MPLPKEWVIRLVCLRSPGFEQERCILFWKLSASVLILEIGYMASWGSSSEGCRWNIICAFCSIMRGWSISIPSSVGYHGWVFQTGASRIIQPLLILSVRENIPYQVGITHLVDQSWRKAVHRDLAANCSKVGTGWWVWRQTDPPLLGRIGCWYFEYGLIQLPVCPVHHYLRFCTGNGVEHSW